jgi:WD40 repeat protein
VSGLERAVKWARRQPVVAALLLLIVLLTAASFGLVTWKWREAESAWRGEQDQRLLAEQAREGERQQRVQAEQAREGERQQRLQAEQARRGEREQRLQAEEALYFNRIAFADRERSVNNLRQADDLLELCPAGLRQWEWHYLKRLCHTELRTLPGHAQVINALARSPDGRYLASARGNPNVGGVAGTIQVWDAATLQVVRTLRGHSGGVVSARFSPDSKRLTSVAVQFDLVKIFQGAARLEDVTSCEARVWDLATGQPTEYLPDYTALALAPDGKLAATAELKGTVKVWASPARDRELFALPALPGIVGGLGFSPDSHLLAVGWRALDLAGLKQGEKSQEQAMTKGLKLWDVRTGKEVLTLKDCGTFTFSPDGRRLAAARQDRAICLWDLEKNQELATLRGHTHLVEAVRFSPDGQRLATASQDRTARVWDLATSKELLTLRGHADSVTDVLFSEDGKQLFTTGRDAAIKVWNIATGPEFRELRGHIGVINQVAFAPDGRRLASVGLDGARLWDVSSGTAIATFPEALFCVAISPDGKRLAAGIRDNKVRVWDIEGVTAGERKPAALWTADDYAGKVTAVAFSPDGRHLASASVGPPGKLGPGKVIVSEVATGRPVWAPDLPTGVVALTWRPGGQELATAGMDGVIQVWDTATGQKRVALRAALFGGPTAPIVSLAFSPDGKRLALAAGNALKADSPGDIRLWDMSDDLRWSKDLRGHTASVTGLAFSPDGRRLASASLDTNRGALGEVKLWDVAQGLEVLTLPGQQTVAFSSDGRRLVSVGGEVLGAQAVRIWDGSPAAEQK